MAGRDKVAQRFRELDPPTLTTRDEDEFWALLDALTQYTDNTEEVLEELSPEKRRHYEAALRLQRRLEEIATRGI